MPAKRFGPFKFKNKPGRLGYEIANKDHSVMEITSIKLISDSGSTTKFFVDVEYIESAEEESVKTAE